MKLYWLAAGLLAAALAVAGAREYKLGYIDSEEIISEYEEAKEARDELDEEVARYRAEAESLRAEYTVSLEEYESQELTLSEEGKRAKMAEVEQRKRRYDSYVDQVYREGGKIDQKNRELIAPLVEKINEAVGKLAAAEGFALVIDASKSEIVFAEAGLDLTRLVIEELNREYTPVGPVVEDKKVHAVFPVFATNDEARQDRIDLKIRQFVYDLVRDQPRVEMTANQKVNEQLQARGIDGRQLESGDVLPVAAVLDVDHAIFGSCSKQDRRISFSLTIVDVRLNSEVKTETGDASREEDLQEQVARVVQMLLASVQKP
ncbi:OmpH family outer membrane protein [candidate division WOR-3 bacterium]|nr:OmpH family outer membrane protein [candidate division WOR-3 bacterium]